MQRKRDMLRVCIILIGLVNVASAETLQVPKDFKTVQAAIDAAKAGDTVLVAKGKYAEALRLKSGVSLQALEPDTILTEQVTAEQVENGTIEGFTILGGREDSHFAIWAESANLIIRKNAILNWHHAITARASKGVIEQNTISGSYRAGASTGVDVFSCKDIHILNNKIIDNEGTAVIITDARGDILVSGNLIVRNTGNGIECVNATPKVKIRKNRITEDQVGLSIVSGEPDIGTVNDPGQNTIHSNKRMEIINSGAKAILAQQNYWGTPKGPDAKRFEGKVIYEPFLTTEVGANLRVEPLLKLTTTWGKVKRDF
ncbi:DUF1565 domain-containing protein [Candidatus Poribacteria bacterium]|nr:DUF1565 domain-containing protein [Candidatus Poribacteria bacterium]